jgi:hypothetical protein
VKNEEARVHFIPTLKDGVFVTLCAPLVINPKNKSEKSEKIQKNPEKTDQGKIREKSGNIRTVNTI